MSSHVTHFQALASYNSWMNERLYGIADSLTDDERKRDLGAFFRSVHGTLNHLLLGDRFLLGRIRMIHSASRALNSAAVIHDFEPARELYSDYAVLREERRATDSSIERWTAELTDEVLSAELPNGRRLWFLIGHLFNHQTHHRGQVTTLLKQLGRDPGITDLNRLPLGAA